MEDNLQNTYIYKECAKASSVDHTATYLIEKVLKLTDGIIKYETNSIGNDESIYIPI